MAEEFRCNNSPSVVNEFAQALSGLEILYEPHVGFKKRIPDVIGIIRTGDTIQYANMILESS
jgi:D-ribose pyranase